MAASLITDAWATATNATSSTTIVLTAPANGANAGQTLLIPVSSRGFPVGSAGDSRDATNNVYTVDITKGYNANVYISIIRCTFVTGLVSGDTITITFTGAVFQKAASASLWSGIASSSPVDQSVSPAGGFGSALDTGNMAATSNANDLVFGAFAAAAGSGVTYTAGANLTALATLSTDTNGATGNSRTVVPFYRIVAATGTYKVNATASTNEQWSGAVVAYKAGSPTVTYNDSGTGGLTMSGTATSTLRLSTYTDSGSGTLGILQGAFTSSLVGAGPQYTGTGAGSLAISGTSTSTFVGPIVYTDARTGGLTVGGASASTFIASIDYVDSGTGNLVLSGTAASQLARVLTLAPSDTLTITLAPY